MSTRETRRLQGPAGTNLDDGEASRCTSTIAHPGDSERADSQAIQRRAVGEWIYAMVRKCENPPAEFGSDEWLAAEEGTPEKVAPVCRAAWAWFMDRVNAPENLARELDERRRLDKAHEDAEHAERAAGHRHRWGHLRVVRDRAGLDARVAEARRPRPGGPDA